MKSSEEMTRNVIERGEMCIRKRKKQRAFLIKALPVFSISFISLATALSLSVEKEASNKGETDGEKQQIQFSSQAICTSATNALTTGAATHTNTETTINSVTTVTELSNEVNTVIKNTDSAVYTDMEQNSYVYTTTLVTTVPAASVDTTPAKKTQTSETVTATETMTTEWEDIYPACMGALKTVTSDFVSDNGVFVPAGSIEVSVYIGKSINFEEAYLFKEMPNDPQLICDSNGVAAYNSASEFENYIFDISISDDGSKLIISSTNSDISPSNCIMLKFYIKEEIDIRNDNLLEIAELK